MDTIVLLLAMAIAGTGALLVIAGVRTPEPAADIAQYLDDYEEGITDAFDHALNEQSLFRRAVLPLLQGLSSTFGRLAPSDLRLRTHQKLVSAGVAHIVRAEEFLAGQAVATTLGGLMGIIVATSQGDRTGLAVGLFLPFAGTGIPSAWLNRRIEERQDEMRRDLPNVVELVQVAVEAGATFETALQLIVAERRGALAVEMRRLLHEMSLGVTRKDAINGLRERVDLPEINNFVTALIQADALGMPLGRVLKSQATELRLRRRQWAREKAGKLPVKITMPLVLCIFPPILVITLYPALSDLTTAF